DCDFILPKQQVFTDDRTMSTRINHLAVWVLVILHQLIGFGWYAVFGNMWLNYHAKTMTDIEQTHSVVPYVIAIVAFDLRELCPGLADRAAERPQCSLRFEDRLALLVLFSLCRVRDYLSVLCL